MLICRVMGTVVSTIKHEVYKGRKLLVVQPQTPDGKDKGNSLLAVDLVQAGVGDKVLVLTEGSSSRTLLGNEMAPVHAVIVGVIDEVDVR